VRVAIADDQVLLREGLGRLLVEVGMEVVASEGDVDSFLQAVEQSLPDVAILDIRMPPTFTDEGLRAADQMRTRHPEVAVLVLSQYLNAGYALRLLESFPGGIGYLLKDRVSNVAVLVDTLQRLVAGECVVDPSIVARLVNRTAMAQPLSQLTPQERDILGLMAEGRPNAAIAQHLVLSEQAVEDDARAIFDKLGLTDMAEDSRRVVAVLAFLRDDVHEGAMAATGPRISGLAGSTNKQVLVTVLFTDIVGSTELMAELGNSAWRDLLHRHHAVVRRELSNSHGRELDTAGDGFFAVFDSPASAVRAARSITHSVQPLGLTVRAGLHAGECEISDGKVTGIAVSVGARISSLAAPNEVLVSNTVKDLVAGSELRFDDRGDHELKGIPGTRQLFALVDEES
jgi:DNA-binding NarL/FixJ family response regulator